jgi:O-glycosyl hydrolase
MKHMREDRCWKDGDFKAYIYWHIRRNGRRQEKKKERRSRGLMDVLVAAAAATKMPEWMAEAPKS